MGSFESALSVIRTVEGGGGEDYCQYLGISGVIIRGGGGGIVFCED